MEAPNKQKKLVLLATIFASLLALFALFMYWFTPDWLRILVEEKYETEPFDQESPVTLKVVFEDKEQFMRSFGTAFQLRYPNVSFEVISSTVPGRDRQSGLEAEEAQSILEREHPDIVILNPQAYAGLASEGYLVPIDNWIKQDKFDLNALDAGIVDSLRELSGDFLYGLAPKVDRMGLFYNRQLFDMYGIPLPVSHMSWNDVLLLARRFPARTDSNRIYGLSLSSPSTPGRLIEWMGRTNGLELYDTANQQLTLQTDGWRSIWNEALDSFRLGSVLWEKARGKDLFLTGQAAMTVQLFLFINTLRANAPDLSWDVVTEPVNPSSPDRSPTFNIPLLYAINAKSAEIPVAWELLKMINSKEIAAKTLRESSGIPFLARKQQLLDYVKSTGMTANVGVFYDLKPAPWNMDMYENIPIGSNKSLTDILDRAASDLLNNQATLQQALQYVETELMELQQNSGDGATRAQGGEMR